MYKYWAASSGKISLRVLLLDSPACDVCCQVAETECWTIQQQHWKHSLKGGTVMEYFHKFDLLKL